VYSVAPAHHTELCHGPAFVLSHDDDAHEPRWVAWAVTAEHLKTNVGRTDDFRLDPALPPGAGARPSDYDKSGYDQGHMSDAEDNGWSPATEHLSFLMSNMIPQCPACNRQTWRYIENWTRDEAKKAGALYVVSGPMLDDPSMVPPKTIGRDKVWVPSASWKIVLDLAGHRGWGFIVPNETARLRPGADITPYAASFAAIERATGLKLPIPAGSGAGPLN
jgi:endonuclease G